MSLIGWILAVFGAVGLIFGVRMMLKLKKITTVPFKKPSEIAKAGQGAADAKGLVSTEGQVADGAGLLAAPMSGERCMAYEVKIERKWEKDKVTDKGTETQRGTSTVMSEYKGASVSVSDGTGAVTVDLSKKPDAKMVEVHQSTVKVGTFKDAVKGVSAPPVLEFGKLKYDTPALPKDARTTGFVGTETILKPSQTLYVLGALQGTTIVEPPGALAGKLVLSSEGREVLFGKTKLHRTLGFAIGGVLALGGTGMGLFAPKEAAKSDEAAAVVAKPAAPEAKAAEASAAPVADSAPVAAAPAPAPEPSPAPAPAPVPAKVVPAAAPGGAYVVGAKVQVNWKGSWYPAAIKGAKDGKFKIHYDGYADSWDEWVGTDRLKAP